MDWLYGTTVVDFYSGQWWIFTPALTSRTPAQRQRQGRSEDIEREERKPSVNERLKDVLNKPRERLEPDNDREQERDDDENENTRDRDRGEGHSL